MKLGEKVKKAANAVKEAFTDPPKDASQAAPRELDDPELVSRAYALLTEYESAYAGELKRLEKCELYYKNKHWDEITKKDENEPRPVTPALHSAIESAKSELMDRYPQATILPETPDDNEITEIVSAVIRQNHDSAHYKKEYARLVHDLLVSGYCVQEVGYDVRANRGLGGAFIRWVDVFNIMFDPQATEDIQDSRAVIKVIPRTIDWLEYEYPHYKGQFATESQIKARDPQVTFDGTKSALMLEYWWREFVPDMYEGVGGYRVHMAQIAGKKLLGDSRIQKPNGYFTDGEYPFVLTYMFERKGSPLGHGMVDVHGDQQLMADKLDQQVAVNAVLASKMKLLVTEACGFDADDLRDFGKQVHKGESLSGITWFQTPALPDYLLTYIGSMRQGMYETSGANDVSQGNMNAGVTSARAIMSLQQASNKRMRSLSDRFMDDFKRCVRKEVEAEREFNVLPREVVVKHDKVTRRAKFESGILRRKTESGVDVPIEFEISIKVEVENKWSTEIHNSFITECVKTGILTPQQGFELVIIEGKDAIISKMNETPQPSDPAQLVEQQAMDQAGQQQAQLAGQVQQMQPPDAVLA
jgi:hypothetical protein